MKKTILAAALAAATAMSSCQKQHLVKALSECDVTTPIRFVVGEDFSGDSGFTRSVSESTVSTLQSGGMYVTATRGVRGTDETMYMTCIKHDVSGNASTSSYYWPSDAAARLSFYALNLQKTPVLSSGTDKVTVPLASTDGDVIAAFADSSATSHGGAVGLVFHHVMARLYDIKLSTKDASARATIHSITVTPASDGGNYDFVEGKVIGTTAGTARSISVASNIEINSTPKSVGQSTVDRLLIEGDVTLQVTYTLKRNGYESTMTKTGIVNLPAGQKTTVTGVLSDDAQGIAFTVQVQPWTEAELNANLS